MSNIFILCIIGGYFLGSLPFGLILTKIAGVGDIRKIGSGNIGATNVLRTGRKDLALLTVLLDAAKAGFAAWLALAFVPVENMFFAGIYTQTNLVAALYAGTAAVLGHNFPIWLGFKGGKGVASSFGFILVINPLIALLALATWLAFAFVFKYSSMAALAAAALTPLYSYFYAGEVETVFFSVIALLLIFRHHANIRRLLRGEESKISFRKKATAPAAAEDAQPTEAAQPVKTTAAKADIRGTAKTEKRAAGGKVQKQPGRRGKKKNDAEANGKPAAPASTAGKKRGRPRKNTGSR